MPAFDFLGPYRIGKLLGRGGMGSVYEAAHEKSGEKVAGKVLVPQIADDMRFRRRFAIEIENLKRVRHQNIVRIIGHGEQADHLFYSMELAEGETLQQRIRRLKRLDWLAAVDIAIQIAAALKHAHDIGSIHRDLKPANIVLVEDSTVKIIDWGIGKLWNIDTGTVAGSVLGSADFMAPEQAGEGAISIHSDLYGLGSVMYAMLAGRPPFTGKKLTEVVLALKRDRPVPLDLINPDLPDSVVALVNDLLQKDPADRPRTALAVLNRLKALRAGLQKQQTLRGTGTHTGEPSADSPSQTDRGDGDSVVEQVTGIHSSATNERAGDATNKRRPGTAISQNGSHSVRPSEFQPTVESQDHLPTASPDEYDLEVNESEPKTHFQLVNEKEFDDHLLGRNQDGGSLWVQWLSIAGMLCILAVGGMMIFRTLQTPSADALYERIVTAEANDELLSAEQTMKQFLKYYADDSRATEVLSLQQNFQSDRYIRRLQNRADRAGGLEQLTAAEQAFYLAIKHPDVTAETTKKKLQSWLDVYGAGPNSNHLEVRLMAIAARGEIQRLSIKKETNGPDLRLTTLRDHIIWSKSALDKDKRRKLLQGIIDLHAGQSWADSATKKAKAELDALANE